MMLLRNRFPTVAEALMATSRPLSESYWWFTGWNFNRPVIAKIGVGGHVKHGAFVWIMVGESCSPAGYRDSDLRGIKFELRGPIEVPKDLRAAAAKRRLAQQEAGA